MRDHAFVPDVTEQQKVGRVVTLRRVVPHEILASSETPHLEQWLLVVDYFAHDKHETKTLAGQSSWTAKHKVCRRSSAEISL